MRDHESINKKEENLYILITPRDSRCCYLGEPQFHVTSAIEGIKISELTPTISASERCAEAEVRVVKLFMPKKEYNEARGKFGTYISEKGKNSLLALNEKFKIFQPKSLKEQAAIIVAKLGIFEKAEKTAKISSDLKEEIEKAKKEIEKSSFTNK